MSNCVSSEQAPRPTHVYTRLAATHATVPRDSQTPSNTPPIRVRVLVLCAHEKCALLHPLRGGGRRLRQRPDLAPKRRHLLTHIAPSALERSRGPAESSVLFSRVLELLIASCNVSAVAPSTPSASAPACLKDVVTSSRLEPISATSCTMLPTMYSGGGAPCRPAPPSPPGPPPGRGSLAGGA